MTLRKSSSVYDRVARKLEVEEAIWKQVKLQYDRFRSNVQSNDGDENDEAFFGPFDIMILEEMVADEVLDCSHNLG